MALLLLICLTLACLPIEWPAPRHGFEPWGRADVGSAILTGAIVTALLLIARVFTATTVGRLARDPGDRETAARGHSLRRLVFPFLNLAGLGLALWYGGWGWTVKELLTTKGGMLLPGAQLLILAPYLVTLLGSWALFYDAELALHGTSPDPAVRDAFWSRSGYVGFLLRHHLLMVFLPLLLVIAQLGVLQLNPQLLDSAWAKVLGFAGVFVIILLIPSLVPLVLGLRRMPPGRLRDRLEAAARRLGVRYRHLYVWDTRGNLATAMVTGLVPRLRQIVFTDLLLQTLSEDEVEAVFGHEVGHVRHGHLLYYAVFLLLSFLTLGAAYRGVELALGHTLLPGEQLLILSVIATGAYLFLVFGFVSRRCERQADVFGCKAVSCADPNCTGHQPDTVLAARGTALCRTGVGTFVRALERVDEINGAARGTVAAARRGLFGRLAGLLRLVGIGLATWQHSTIAKRVTFLRTLAEDPKRERRFQWGVTALRWALLLALVGGVLGVAVLSGWRSMLDGV
jgi:STE24 endopeptidase